MRRMKIGSIFVSVAMLLGSYGIAHSQEDSSNYIDIGGYVRSWVSFNLQDIPETSDNDKGKISMLRGSLLIDVDAGTGPIQWKAVGRLDREYKTDYLQDLEDLREVNGTLGGDDSSITDNYNNADIRELWAQFKLGDRATVRLGKQQIVWGESDFFQAMDVVHGYDLSWRLFFEGENEEWRKPLWLANMKVYVPEASGEMQLFVRPGLDRCEDIGSTYDYAGGRWFTKPYRGFDLTALTTKDCDHPEGDKDDMTGGIRWSGTAGPVNYSLAYIKTFSAAPVANSVYAPYKKVPSGALFDIIHPEIDVFGATISGYSATLDTVLSAEIAYTKDQPFNVGIGPLDDPISDTPVGLGLGGIITKDVINTMVRADFNLPFQRFLGTTRPSFSSIQLFDTWVQDFSKSDGIAPFFAYGGRKNEHETLLTAFTGLNYRNDTINPGLAVGTDLSNGGGFLIPSVAFVMGNNWRARIEADLFWNTGTADYLFDADRDAKFFGWFDNNSQLVFRVTRQF